MNETEITIENILVIVVDGLHHFVAAPKGASEPDHRGFALITVEGCLKVEIESPCPDPPPVNWAEHLHLANRIEAEPCRDAAVYELDDLASCVVRFIGLDPIEVQALLGLVIQLGHLTAVDAMGIDHDPALRRLTKDLSQTRSGHHRRLYDVREHLTRTHRGQLVRVAYQQKSRLRWQRPDERGHQRHVHHRDLIHHQ